MIWNDFGAQFYIWIGENKLLSALIVLVNPWFMPMLFALAGISARYALEMRTPKQFMMQRIRKLLIPFFMGVILLVPIQTLYARKFFDGYTDGVLRHWRYFFTHVTDLSGYDGAFTPGHLWFILFLFIISLASLAIFKIMPYQKCSVIIQKMPVIVMIMLCVPIWLMYYIGNFGGFSIGKNFILYLLGYYFLSNDAVLEKLKRNIKWLLALCIIATIASAALYVQHSYYGDLWICFVGWISILTLLPLGKQYLNRKTKFIVYFNQASYPVYILHQSILVALAYYIVQMCDGTALQACVICIGSFVLTVLAYHIVKRIPVVRMMIGLGGQ